MVNAAKKQNEQRVIYIVGWLEQVSLSRGLDDEWEPARRRFRRMIMRAEGRASTKPGGRDECGVLEDLENAREGSRAPRVSPL